MKEISNRSAIVVSPKKPFCDWAEMYSESSLEELEKRKTESHVYLIDWTHDENLSDVMEPYYQMIFEYELSSWNSLTNEWPKNRTYQNFTEWFDVFLCDDLFDLETERITLEKL